MSKIKTIVNKQELINAVQQAESKGPLSNRTELASVIAQSEWAKVQNKPLTISVILARIKEYKIQPKTPVGKRVRNNSIVKKNRIINKTFSKHIELLKKTVPKKYHNLIDKIEQGSKVATIKLKCLDCSDYQTSEIRQCAVEGCPLYSARPYK